MNKKQKKIISATLAGIMSAGISVSMSGIASAATVEQEASKPADFTAKEVAEPVYKVLFDGTKDEALLSGIRQLVTKTKDGIAFNAADVQADVDAIQSSGLVEKAVARSIQSNGRLYVVFSVTPLEKEDDSKDVATETAKAAAGQMFEASDGKKDAPAENAEEKVSSKELPAGGVKDSSVSKPENVVTSKDDKAGTKISEAVPKTEAKDGAKDEDNIVSRIHKILDEYHGKNTDEPTAAKKDVSSNAQASAGSQQASAVPAIEDIKYVGNTKTKDWVLDKMVSRYVRKGDAINTEKLQFLYNDLYATGYFKSLDVRLMQGSAPNKGVVEIDMKEDKTGEWSFGLGASTQNKMQVIGSVKDTNVGGIAQSMGLDFGVGTKRSNGELFYTNPYVGKSDTSLNISVFGKEKDDDWRDLDYTEKRAGASMTLAKPISADKTTKLYGGLSFNHITTDSDWIEDLNTTLAFVGVSKLAVDNVISPHSGYGWDINASASMKALGSDYNFQKYSAGIKGYAPLSNKDVLAARLRYDYADKTLPFLEQFTLGGTDSVRGLDEDELRGDRSILGTVEFRHDLNSWLQGVAFVDFGRTWNDNTDDGEDGFKVSPGLGLRAVTKMGILRFDAAKIDGHNMKFVFGIGQSF